MKNSRRSKDKRLPTGRRKHVDKHFAEMADVTPKPLEYLWEPWIPSNAMTMLDGNPGVGKSYLTIEIAAAVTKGRACGEGSSLKQSNVLFLCIEDDVEQIIQPRLVTQGADLARIRYLSDPFPLDKDGVKILRQELLAHPAILVVIDPFVAFMPYKFHMNAANEVREFTKPLSALARELNIAILVVRHLRKSAAADAIYKGLGSADFMAGVRSGVIVAKNPRNNAQKILAQTKANYSGEQTSLVFEISDDGDTPMPQLKWRGKSDWTADELTAEMEKMTSSRLGEAKDFLKMILSGSSLTATHVNKVAQAAGISKKTIERARKELGVGSSKGPGSKLWLPESAPKTHDRKLAKSRIRRSKSSSKTYVY